MHSEVMIETSDRATCTEGYSLRFNGETGKWMLSVQEDIILNMLSQEGVKTILDVGGGHGQVAIPLAHNGYDVTVLGSSAECRKMISDEIEAGRLRFIVGNPLQLPFPNKSFDAAVCIRLLSHTLNWKRLLRELCRVSRKCIIVDYPSFKSFNAVSGLFFPLKKKIEGNTRPFRVFFDKEVIEALSSTCPGTLKLKREFFLPMVFHRVLKNAKVSRWLELIFAHMGLTFYFGSPVILEWIQSL
ncbi:MAG: class I SAM-dependent methyltransferase [Candidatus Dadabacteria bacterium]|nr:MAG: class I SAM-dependent methyltransferase [Candidatus Dadabacteria bacterium]